VLVYAGDERIATHSRQGVDRRSTNEKHLPPHRRELAGRSLGYWLERAERFGPAAGRYVREVAESDEVLEKLRDVQAIVTYLERFPRRRIEGTSKRASYFGIYTYTGVRRILERALDLEPLPESRPRHGESSAPRFARTAGELVAHEPGGAA